MWKLICRSLLTWKDVMTLLDKKDNIDKTNKFYRLIENDRTNFKIYNFKIIIF